MASAQKAARLGEELVTVSMNISLEADISIQDVEVSRFLNISYSLSVSE